MKNTQLRTRGLVKIIENTAMAMDRVTDRLTTHCTTNKE